MKNSTLSQQFKLTDAQIQLLASVKRYERNWSIKKMGRLNWDVFLSGKFFSNHALMNEAMKMIREANETTVANIIK